MKKNDVQFSSLRELIDFALGSKSNKRGFFDLGKLSQKQILELQEQTGLDFSEFKRIIDSYSIKHIIKNHGNPEKEERRGQKAITSTDIESLPELMQNLNSSELDGTNRIGREVLKHQVETKDRVTIIEEIRTNKKLLALDSMRKK